MIKKEEEDRKKLYAMIDAALDTPIHDYVKIEIDVASKNGEITSIFVQQRISDALLQESNFGEVQSSESVTIVYNG